MKPKVGDMVALIEDRSKYYGIDQRTNNIHIIQPSSIGIVMGTIGKTYQSLLVFFDGMLVRVSSDVLRILNEE
jgi:hypothetical protein